MLKEFVVSSLFASAMLLISFSFIVGYSISVRAPEDVQPVQCPNSLATICDGACPAEQTCHITKRNTCRCEAT
jgi:hypothetical protein